MLESRKDVEETGNAEEREMESDCFNTNTRGGRLIRKFRNVTATVLLLQTDVVWKH